MAKTYYKYRDLSNFESDPVTQERIKDILQNKKLFAAQFEMLNDPMEGFYYLEEQKEQKKEFIQKLYRSKSYNKICSLARKSDNMALWTHYAGNGNGIVIGVNIEKDSEINIVDVEYKKLLPRVNPQSQSDLDTIAKNILRVKLEEWRYEKESRIFTPRSYVIVKIKSVLYGYKVKDETKALLNSWITPSDNIKIENFSIESKFESLKSTPKET